MERTLVSLEKTVSSPLVLAERYYALLSEVAALNLTPRDVQLLAFTAVRGGLSGSGRIQFVKHYNTSKASLANTIHKLHEEGYILKEKRKIVLHPSLVQDFSRPFIIQLSLHVDQASPDRKTVQ